MSTERYVVRQDDGQLETQDRRRESWRAADGWAWARQTGSDPGRFIFGPDTEWETVRAADPTPAAQRQVLRKAVGSARTADDDTRAEFAFVEDLLSVESVPESALPKNYRAALVGALADHGDVTSTRHVDDPAGRDATRVAWKSGSLSLAFYLDSNYNFLASTQTAADTGESGSRVITERRWASAIPQDLLAQLGSDRVEKTFWY